MAGPLGFPGLGYKHHHRPHDPYTGGNEYYRGNRDTLFGDFATHQRHAHVRMFSGNSSPYGRMGGYQSPFTGLGGVNPMMGGYPSPGFSSPLGMGMGMGMGMGPHGRRPVIGHGYQQPSPFGMGTLPRGNSTFPHRQRGYSSWPRAQRSPFSSRFVDEDGSEDDDDYSMLPMYSFPRRRRGGFRHYRQAPHGRSFRGTLLDDYDEDYDGYENFDEEDDDDDFDDFFPPRRWQRY
ncbi:uncharacterized protein K460DRAFT_400800 [Cucurbitaria berberidis CBS 394.84]|uniref:Uncharacterized protein n=1 Tax=Cucurbitaria berberidis CBS 394.84 TaxID=1168544 RepID=A0A9P4LCH5_9PLEO|nr:uncharacterized protein K460DRAFT_400800 [Cucurbitaria berberidis CBS 394.84]KAF1850761.1 hypothetical protein K460DRAFT_400800 [Cucurbitaria berberidis CBS 394.84]